MANNRKFGLNDLIAAAGIGALVVRFLPAPRPSTALVRRTPFRDADVDVPSEVQQARALEPGRGRGARLPWHIPLAGWKDILWRTYQQIGEDRLLAVAAGVVFYGLLAIFPAISAFVSVYGLFADVATVRDHLSLVAQVVPADALGPIEEQVGRVTATGNGTLSLAFLLSLGIALWSANAGMKAIIDALNVAYDETERRGFIKLTLISLAMTACVIIAGLIAVGAVVVFPLVTSFLGLGSETGTLIAVLRWPVLVATLLLGLAVLYRFGPNRTKPRWQWVSVGSVVAAVLWLAGSAALSLYLSRFADYGATYGSLAAGIGLMMWLWLSAIVVLLGAELNAEIEHQTARDSTVGPDKPLGARGATMADTVGAAQD
jgi:membrane protein